MRPIFVVLGITALFAVVSNVTASTPVQRTVERTLMGKSIHQWHQIAVKRRVERDRARSKAGDAIRETRRLRVLAAKNSHSVSYAIHLAATAYGVSETQMHRVASCESGHSATAVNGRYRGVFQEGPMFEGGPFGRAGFSVWDPLANAMMAAYTVSREGWSQWSCKP